MMLIRWYFSRHYWLDPRTYKVFGTSILSVFGSMWLIVEILNFVSSSSVQPVRDQWLLFLLAGIAAALYFSRPRLRHSVIIQNTDVKVEIVVDDFFAQSGDYIIGTNTTFDTTLADNYIHPRSIQGQFTRKFYSSEAHLDLDINNALTGINSISITKEKGKQNKYPIGTVAKIRTPQNYSYFLAIAHINGKGNTESTIDELKTAYSELWTFIQSSGEFDKLVIPILGSGFSRVNATREYLIQEMLKSFLAAMVDRKFTEHLVVVIHSKDVFTNKVDLKNVFDFLSYLARFSNLKTERSSSSAGVVS